jgi:hypothetical protein
MKQKIINRNRGIIFSHFHLICWLYHICHSTFIWYVYCIISIIQLPCDMLTVSYLSFHFHLIYWVQSTYQMKVEWQIWYTQHNRWKWNDRYDTFNISDGSGITDMIQSTYQIEVEWQTSIWYVECIISVIPLPSDMLTVLYLSFNFYLICWLYHICHSTSIWYVEWHIRWKWNDIWYSQPIKWK